MQQVNLFVYPSIERIEVGGGNRHEQRLNAWLLRAVIPGVNFVFEGHIMFPASAEIRPAGNNSDQ